MSKRNVLALFAALALTACNDTREQKQSGSGRGYKVECIDGVEYWYRIVSTGGVMAPRINPKTMSFVGCAK